MCLGLETSVSDLRKPQSSCLTWRAKAYGIVYLFSVAHGRDDYSSMRYGCGHGIGVLRERRVAAAVASEARDERQAR